MAILSHFYFLKWRCSKKSHKSRRGFKNNKSKMTEENKKILIVEDEKSYANALALKLTNAGYTVSVAQNGREGVDILKEEEFDLIFLDLIMPEMNGFDVLNFMKENEIKTNTIVFSTLSQETDINKAFDLGAVDFVNKSDVSIAGVLKVAKEYTS